MSEKKDNDLIISAFKKELRNKLKFSRHTKYLEDKDKKLKWQMLDNVNNIKYTNTYVIELSKNNPKNIGFDYKYLVKILEGYGLKRSSDPNGNHMFGIINEEYYETRFYLLNNFNNIESFDEKYNLYFNLKEHFPKYYNANYPNSFMLSSNLKWDDIKNQIYIARPISGQSGEGIINIHTPQSLASAQKLLLEKYSTHGISLTEYVTNPLLINKRKMHLRAYMLFTLINNTFRSYFLDCGKILTARAPYVNGDWNNKDIHDTHMDSSYRKDLLFPDDLYGNTTPNIKNAEDFDIIHKNIRESILYISRIAASNIYNYSNTINTYEVFGIDIFIRDDFSVFIMEVNSKYVSYVVTTKLLFEKYNDWIHETVIKPALFPHLETKKSLATTPIYEVTIKDY